MDLFIWGNAESTVTIIAASIPVLRVLIRDRVHSHRYYKSNDSGKKTNSKLSEGSVKKATRNAPANTLVVTITGGPPDERKLPIVPDDGSDKSILGGNLEPRRSHGGRIVCTNDFSVEYSHEEHQCVEMVSV